MLYPSHPHFSRLLAEMAVSKGYDLEVPYLSEDQENDMDDAEDIFMTSNDSLTLMASWRWKHVCRERLLAVGFLEDIMERCEALNS